MSVDLCQFAASNVYDSFPTEPSMTRMFVPLSLVLAQVFIKSLSATATTAMDVDFLPSGNKRNAAATATTPAASSAVPTEPPTKKAAPAVPAKAAPEKKSEKKWKR